MNDNFLADCEPHAYEGLITLGEYSRRIQGVVYEVVERNLAALEAAMALDAGSLSLGEHWWPTKWQSIDPDVWPAAGAKLRGPNGLEVAVFRMWGDEKPWLGIWLWIKPRARLDMLADALDEVLEPCPGKEDEWSIEREGTGVHYLYRQLRSDELGSLDEPLTELLEHYIHGLRKIGGIRRFLEAETPVTATPS